MKKSLTILLLLIFCTMQITLAGEVIIVGSDGQARYEGINTMQENDSIQVEKSNLNIQPINKNDSLYRKYDNKFRKYLKKNKHSMSFRITDNYLMTQEQISWRECLEGSYKLNKDTETLKVKLKDGDYAVLHEYDNVGYKYAIEYHKDGTIMGFVNFDLVKNTESEAVAIFYEYRISDDKLVLKHTFCLNINKNENSIVQFIYDVDGNVKCYQVKDKIYCANGDNLIIDTEGFSIRNYTNKESAVIMEDKVISAITSNPITGIGIGIPLLLIISFPPIRIMLKW